MTPTDVVGNRRLSGGPLAAVRGGRGPGRRYVVMPVGGGGAWVISMARSGVQPIGGQSSQKTQIVWAVGRAALGAITPRQPSVPNLMSVIEGFELRSYRELNQIRAKPRAVKAPRALSLRIRLRPSPAVDGLARSSSLAAFM